MMHLKLVIYVLFTLWLCNGSAEACHKADPQSELIQYSEYFNFSTKDKDQYWKTKFPPHIFLKDYAVQRQSAYERGLRSLVFNLFFSSSFNIRSNAKKALCLSQLTPTGRQNLFKIKQEWLKMKTSLNSDQILEEEKRKLLLRLTDLHTRGLKKMPKLAVLPSRCLNTAEFVIAPSQGKISYSKEDLTCLLRFIYGQIEHQSKQCSKFAGSFVEALAFIETQAIKINEPFGIDSIPLADLRRLHQKLETLTLNPCFHNSDSYFKRLNSTLSLLLKRGEQFQRRLKTARFNFLQAPVYSLCNGELTAVTNLTNTKAPQGVLQTTAVTFSGIQKEIQPRKENSTEKNTMTCSPDFYSTTHYTLDAADMCPYQYSEQAYKCPFLIRDSSGNKGVLTLWVPKNQVRQLRHIKHIRNALLSHGVDIDVNHSNVYKSLPQILSPFSDSENSEELIESLNLRSEF